MSIKQKNSDTAAPKGSAWKKNVIFALVVLALAAGIFLAVRAQHPAKGSGLQAVVDFGDGVTETLPLAQDHDYLYEVGGLHRASAGEGWCHRVFGQSVPGPCL